jgi:hypothetical protein
MLSTRAGPAVGQPAMRSATAMMARMRSSAMRTCPRLREWEHYLGHASSIQCVSHNEVVVLALYPCPVPSEEPEPGHHGAPVRGLQAVLT